MSAEPEKKTAAVAVTDTTFAEEVLQSTTPVLVDFWAPWCGPCRAIGPVVDEVAGEFAGRARVAKVNVDENPELTARYEIAAVPTLLFFKNGRVVDKLMGVTGRNRLADRLESHLG